LFDKRNGAVGDAHALGELPLTQALAGANHVETRTNVHFRPGFDDAEYLTPLLFTVNYSHIS